MENTDGVTPISLYEGFTTIKSRGLSNPSCEESDINNQFVLNKDSRYKNIIYTDGNIKILEKIVIDDLKNIPDNLSIEEAEKVQQIYRENFHINEVVLKRAVLEDATYYIRTELSQVLILMGETHGWLWSLDNIQVNVKEPTTSKILNTIKTTIKLINNQKLNANARMLETLSNKNIFRPVEYNKQSKEVYQLKK